MSLSFPAGNAPRQGPPVPINFYALLAGNFCALPGWHRLLSYGSRTLATEGPEGFRQLFAFVALRRPNLRLRINLAVTPSLVPVLYFLLCGTGLPGAGLHALAYALLTVGALAYALLRHPALAA
ncbi:MAG: hypothetical protein NVS9B10_05780 [Nevskia sp.]